NPMIIDLGCGKLRHLKICRDFSDNIILVDTKEQIERKQKFGDTTATMAEYVKATQDGKVKIDIVETEAFTKKKYNADIVLNVAVMDVVPKKVRSSLVDATYNNLRANGYCILIIPRNDSSILINCRRENKYEDGHIFKNRGHNDFTFYTNFRDPSPLLRVLTHRGFKLIEDLSIYRQICLILQK